MKLYATELLHTEKSIPVFFDSFLSEKRFEEYKTACDKRKNEILTGDKLIIYAVKTEYGIDARGLVYKKHENGKPYFENVPFYFSLTHTDTLCAAAFCRNEIGIDAERVTEVKNRIFERVFSDGEKLYINHAKDRKRAFFEVWTAREAYLKYDGAGLLCKMSSFECDFQNHTVGGVPFLHFYIDENVICVVGAKEEIEIIKIPIV
ncbi:MAG: 4'-phosphopantetheinyl transferase superfamily protein [Clostridia bacterium]|nr:4'-phosphopantetheinyl transferase superfamily protein [Clostridia bacterium]